MKYIALHTNPEYYGSECSSKQADALNSTLKAAAAQAGIPCYIDPSKPVSSQLEADGHDQIDWFAQACAGGWDWSVDQWVAWFGENTQPNP